MPSVTNNGISELRTPKRARVTRWHRAPPDSPTPARACGSVTAGAGGGRDLGLVQSRPGEEEQPDAAGDCERPGVDEEGCPQRDGGERPADRRPGDRTDEEAGLPHAGGLATLVGVDDAQQQGDGRDGEHRRPDAADAAEEQRRLGVGLGETGQGAAHRDDPDAGGEHQPFAEPVDQAAAAECGHQPHEGEGGDHRTGGGAPDAELARVDGDRGGDDAEADGDGEGHGGEDGNLARQAGHRVARPAGTVGAGSVARGDVSPGRSGHARAVLGGPMWSRSPGSDSDCG